MLKLIGRVASEISQGFGIKSEHAEVLARYKELRQVGLELNNRLVGTLSKSVLDEGGKRLGILKKNVLVLDTEDEIAVLMDFCLHDVRRQGQNAIQRFLVQSPPPSGSDERVLLEALAQSRYCLLMVEATVRGVGVHARDLIRDEPMFITDVGFSQSGSPGLVVAARVMFPEGIGMTTGAALPVGGLPREGGMQFARKMAAGLQAADFRSCSAEEMSEIASRVIGHCLRAGAAEHIQYLEPSQAKPARSEARASSRKQRVGRNDPCSCGSARKFKYCCGKRR